MDDISLSPAAEQQIRRSITGRGHGLGIRIGVRTTGCSGLAYTLEFVDTADDLDTVFSHEGFSLFINPKHTVYLSGLEVDFVQQGLNKGFEFINPNERARCGCGESFSV